MVETELGLQWFVVLVLIVLMFEAVFRLRKIESKMCRLKRNENALCSITFSFMSFFYHTHTHNIYLQKTTSLDGKEGTILAKKLYACIFHRKELTLSSELHSKDCMV